jgi:hypothetical protein
MMPSPQGGPVSARVGAGLGPEVVASILVVAVLFVAVAVALSGQRGSAPPSSPEPSLAAVVPSVSAVPSPTPASASPSPLATATPLASLPPPSSTLAPGQAAAARAVLESVDQLLEERAALEAELAKTGTDSKAIADLLRDVNASIVQQDGPLADLAAYPSTADLARRIRAVNAATFETVNRIQHTSPRNAKTYRDGAAEVVKRLEPLPALRAELAQLAG